MSWKYTRVKGVKIQTAEARLERSRCESASRHCGCPPGHRSKPSWIWTEKCAHDSEGSSSPYRRWGTFPQRNRVAPGVRRRHLRACPWTRLAHLAPKRDQTGRLTRDRGAPIPTAQQPGASLIGTSRCRIPEKAPAHLAPKSSQRRIRLRSKPSRQAPALSAGLSIAVSIPNSKFGALAAKPSQTLA